MKKLRRRWMDSLFVGDICLSNGHSLMPLVSCSIAVLSCLFSITAAAQGIRHRIAIFTPLYLDSTFDDLNNYRYGTQFPKFINPGLEFYEGAQLALDSLSKERA